MIKLSNRIEDLQKNTGSLEVKEICENALSEISLINKKRISPSAKKELETNLTEELVEKLSSFKENSVTDFVKKEKTTLNIHNMGLKKSLEAIAESDLKNHPAISYTINSFRELLNQPDFLVAETFYNKFKPFDWHPQVKEELNKIHERFEIYKDDILIEKSIYAIKNSRSAYLLKGINENLNAYLDNRSKKNKEELVERLSRFSFDPLIRNLKNVIIGTSENELQIKEGKGQAIPLDIYSMVQLNEGSEVFGTGQDFYQKTGNDLRKLSETEVSKLDQNFINVTKYLNSDNVKIIGESITIYGYDRKFLIESDESGIVSVTVNDKKMTNEEFQHVYMKSGVLSRKNTDQINMINFITENFHSITKIDFGKRIISPNMANRRIDIFKLEESIYVTKNDPSMGRTDFYKNLNATQSRNMVIEYLNYDISESFSSMIGSEEKKIKEHNKAKQSYIKVISNLEKKINELLTIEDKTITESLEYKNIVKILEEEISKLKEEYNEFVSAIVELEEAPAPSDDDDAGKSVDTENSADNTFSIDDKVRCLKLNCTGTIIGISDLEGTVVYDVLTDNGKTESCTSDEIELLEISESDDLESKIDKISGFIDKLSGDDDDEEDDDEEDDDEEDEDDDDDDDDDDEEDDDEEFDIDGLNIKDPDIKSNESLSEASIIVDAMDPTDSRLLSTVKKLGLGMNILTWKSPSGYPEVEFKGDKKKIEKLLDLHFDGAENFEDMIEESKSLSEDHAAKPGAEPIEDLSSLGSGDRVENSAEVYGTIQGVKDEIVTVLHDDGTTGSYGPGELYLVQTHEDSISEDHAAKPGAEPIEDLSSLGSGDRVENSAEVYGTIQGVKDEIVTVLHDDGTTGSYGPGELYLVQTHEDSISEKFNTGDEVELLDGTRAKINSITDGNIMIIDDQGKTSIVKETDITLIDSIDTGGSSVEGQQTDGKSVDI